MNIYCDMCKFKDSCELARNIMFCDDCAECDTCDIKCVECEAGHYIECNNGWEEKDIYCCEDYEE